MSNSVYDELAIDLLMAGDFTREQTQQIVDYLKGEGLLDYDALKEYYEDE